MPFSWSLLSNTIQIEQYYSGKTVTRTDFLGNDGPHITEIGFGTWAIGGPWKFGWGKTDDSELATKCSQVWDGSGTVRTHASPESVRREIEQSLRRLRADYIDLYQIHWPDWDTPVEETWTEMARLRDEGKTHYIGVCNFGVDLLERCEKIGPVQSLQPIYNLLERDIEREILPYCQSHGIGIVAYSPMQSGLLTGSFDRSKVAADDWRIVHSEKFREPKYSRGLRLVELLRPIAAKYNTMVGQLAVAWVLMNSAVTSAIVGARRAD